MADPARCIRCDTNPAVDTSGYCAHCHWAVRAEVDEGLHELRGYLSSDPHVGYVEWCRLHDLKP